jgi:hypothetical protein
LFVHVLHTSKDLVEVDLQSFGPSLKPVKFCATEKRGGKYDHGGAGLGFPAAG